MLEEEPNHLAGGIGTPRTKIGDVDDVLLDKEGRATAVIIGGPIGFRLAVQL